MGIKTGYTDTAWHCRLFEAVRNGRTLIGVVLGRPATGPAAGAQDAEKMRQMPRVSRPNDTASVAAPSAEYFSALVRLSL